jgi:hypothetical protein
MMRKLWKQLCGPWKKRLMKMKNLIKTLQIRCNSTTNLMKRRSSTTVPVARLLMVVMRMGMSGLQIMGTLWALSGCLVVSRQP